MTNFQDKFKEINVDILDYVSEVIPNGTKCLRDGLDYEQASSEIMQVITEIINLRLDIEENNKN